MIGRTRGVRSSSSAKMSLPRSVIAGILVAAGLLLGVGALLTRAGAHPAAPRAKTSYATAQVRSFVPRLVGYARVEPLTVLPVTAAETGVVTGLRVVPGTRVRAGEKLAHLTGPQIRSLLLQSQADIRSASIQLTASQKSLVILRRQLASHLSTRQAIHQAEAAVAQARKNEDNAQAQLKAVEQMSTLAAPGDGTVLSLNAATGELVEAGQTLLTLQTPGGLWLKATYYGADLSRIHRGLTGRFHPADGEPPIPVRVRTVLAPATAGGGESFGLVPVARAFHWRNGEFGTVTLDLPGQQLVAVPTRALVLDRGTWWVLVHTAHGNHPQAVVLGPSRGWDTFVEHGLAPGAAVVVVNAYLLFHRGISRRYQLPG